MAIGDCCAQDPPIRPIRYAAVDYSEIVPTSGGGPDNSRLRPEGRRYQFVLLHLSALARVEVGPKRPNGHPPQTLRLSGLAWWRGV